MLSHTGSRVRSVGCNSSDLSASDKKEFLRKWENLLLKRKVELGNALGIKNGQVECEVFVYGKNLADYFSEF